MKKLLFLPVILAQSILSAQQSAENYPVDSASIEHPGIPKGELLKFTFDQSKIFPGTWRECWVYVPAQYKVDKPACENNKRGIEERESSVLRKTDGP